MKNNKKKYLKTHCKRCGCEFEYDTDDIIVEKHEEEHVFNRYFVMCPLCDRFVYVLND